MSSKRLRANSQPLENNFNNHHNSLSTHPQSRSHTAFHLLKSFKSFIVSIASTVGDSGLLRKMALLQFKAPVNYEDHQGMFYLDYGLLKANIISAAFEEFL